MTSLHQEAEPTVADARLSRLGLSRLLSNSIAGVIAQVVSLLFVFVVTPYQLAAMGAERYGLCVLTVAAASYITLFDVGGGWAVMRFIPRYQSEGRSREASEAFSVALLASLGVGLFGAFTLWLVAPFVTHGFRVTPQLTGEATSAVTVAGLWLASTLLLGVLSGVGRAIGRFRLWAATSAGSVIAFNVLWVAVARTSRSPVDVMWAQLAVTTATATLWVIVLHRDPQSPQLRLPRDRRLAWQLIRFSALGSIAQAGLLALTTGGTICVGLAVGAPALVYYAIPLSFAQRLTIVSSTVVTILLPTLSETRAHLRSVYEALTTQSHLLVALVTSALSSFLVWAGGSGLTVWISAQFANRATAPLAALALGFGAVSMSSVYQVNLEAVGRVAVPAALALTSGISGIVGAALLPRAYGETGGAVGIMAGLLLMAASVVAASSHYEHTPNRRQLGSTAIVTGSLFAVGGAAHFTAVLLFRGFLAGPWVDIFLTSSCIGLATALLGRRVVRWPASRHIGTIL